MIKSGVNLDQYGSAMGNLPFPVNLVSSFQPLPVHASKMLRVLSTIIIVNAWPPKTDQVITPENQPQR
jgi:hypothetical protein